MNRWSNLSMIWRFSLSCYPCPPPPPRPCLIRRCFLDRKWTLTYPVPLGLGRLVELGQYPLIGHNATCMGKKWGHCLKYFAWLAENYFNPILILLEIQLHLWDGCLVFHSSEKLHKTLEITLANPLLYWVWEVLSGGKSWFFFLSWSHLSKNKLAGSKWRVVYFPFSQTLKLTKMFPSLSFCYKKICKYGVVHYLKRTLMLCFILHRQSKYAKIEKKKIILIKV